MGIPFAWAHLKLAGLALWGRRPRRLKIRPVLNLYHTKPLSVADSLGISRIDPGMIHQRGMLTSEDHRQLAEQCIRLAKECTKPSVAEYLMTLAANYLELAERALRLYEPATAARRQHIKVMQKE